MRLTILRGISGSGKTTWTRRRAPDALVASADHAFFVDGVYRYDPARIAEAHAACFHDFMEGMLRKTPHIVVDNTNVMAWEYSPYVLAGEAYGYAIELLTLRCPLEVSLARKQLVPREQLERTLVALEEETRRMPRRFRGIHRELDGCAEL